MSRTIAARDLSVEALNGVVREAAAFHPELAALFISFVTRYVRENDLLDGCPVLCDIVRAHTDQQLRTIFETGELPDRELLNSALDRIATNARSVRRIPLKKRTKRGGRPVQVKPSHKPITLAERLNAAAPFTATGTRELAQVLRQQGKPITLKTVLTVEQVQEGPEEIGITCVLESTGSGVQFAAPLTYLVLPSASPFYREVEDWRRKRHKIIARLNAGY